MGIAQDKEVVIKQLREQIVKLRQTYPAVSDTWLQLMYETRWSRFQSDNERIWTTGSILIPLSAAGFAAFCAIENPTWIHVVILGVASMSLYWFWLILAANHKAFQRKSLAWIEAIELETGIIDISSPKIIKKQEIWDARFTKEGAVYRWRWILFVER